MNRREFVKSAASISAGSMLVSTNGLFAAGSQKIKVALVGCGNIAKKHVHAIHNYLPEAKIGSQVTNPRFVEKKPPEPPLSERFPWLFPTVVAVAAIMVALLLIGILRQARKVLPPPKE